MAYNCVMVCDSLSPADLRLSTLEITYPRIVHSEFMTHRDFSRNAASSRAIPVEKMIGRVKDDPFIPIYWGKNQKGMQAEQELSGLDRERAIELWLQGRDEAVRQAEKLLALGVHKQIANRVLEPYSWITVIVSATRFSNFDALRCHPHAQPELNRIAVMMRETRLFNIPTPIQYGEWHLPYIQSEERAIYEVDVLKALSTARCARVSYLNQNGKRDTEEDLGMYERLKSGSGTGHWSPFEHVASAQHDPDFSGNFFGFSQHRKEFEGECR